MASSPPSGPAVSPTPADIALVRHLVAARRLDRAVAAQAIGALRSGAFPGRRLSDLLRERQLIDEGTLRRAQDDVLVGTFRGDSASSDASDGSDPSAASAATGSLPPEVAAAMGDPARRLGRYVVVGELGRGGMGVVYRAFDPQLHRPVAIKVLAAVGPADDARRQRFAREARTAARLRHPGIVAVHEVGEHRGQPFLVMDFVDGAGLDVLLDRTPIAPRRAAELVRDVARALAHAHEHDIVHRDVKPANILIERAAGDDAEDPFGGRPLLTDFGLAAELRGSERLTSTGQLLGTPQYMAPEQAAPDRGTSAATDVYGLGGVLYRALAGRPAFDDQELIALIRKLMVVEPAPLRRLNEAVHRDLETIVGKCLEKDPARRYPDAGALADDLDRYCRGEPIAARPPGRVERVRRWVRQRRLAAVAIAALALAGVGVALSAGWALLEVRRQVAAERTRFVEQARRRAEESTAAFDRIRGQGAPAAETAEARRRRHDELLARGLDAISAATTLRALARDEEEVARTAFAVAFATGEVAIESEQWSVAASAFEKALATGVDARRARAALARVAQERERVAREHRAAVEGVIAEARSGALARRPGGHEAAVFTLVRYPEAQTVSLLAGALGEVTAKLRAASRAFYARAEMPDEAEAKAGARPIAGLTAALDRWLAREIGEGGDANDLALLERAAKRLVRRESARRAPESRVGAPLGSLALEAAAQRAALGPHERALARLCCDALGRLGIRDGAVDPIARYLQIEASEEHAIHAGIALCLLGGERAQSAVIAACGRRFGTGGELWTQVSRYLKPLESSKDATGAVALVERGLLRASQGDLEGAVADYTLALEDEPEDARIWTNRGVARLRSGDVAGGRADLDRAVAIDPAFAGGWVNRAMCRYGVGDFEGAIADATRAIGLDPELTIAYINRATAHTACGDLDAALADATAAVEKGAQNGLAWACLGTVRHLRGEAAAAIEAFDRALEIDPRHPEGLQGRAQARRELGDLDGALSDLGRLIELQPKDVEAWLVRAQIRRDRGDLAGAIADFTDLIGFAGDGAGPWIGRGTTHYAQGDYQRAVEDLTRAIDIDPAAAVGWSCRGSARMKTGDLDGAKSDLHRALQIDSNDAQAWANLAYVELSKRNPRAAILAATNAIEVAPGYSAGWVNRGLARSSTGDLDGALADLTRAVEVEPGLAVAWTNRGIIHYRRKDYRSAIADHTRAIEIDPSLAVALVNRAVSRELVGELDGAFADYTAALQVNPRLADVWYNRALMRRDRGDREGAIADLERCIELNPRDAQARERLAALRAGGD